MTKVRNADCLARALRAAALLPLLVAGALLLVPQRGHGQEAAPVPGATAPATPPGPARPGPVRNGPTQTLDRRMQAMTKELHLDAGQQLQVRQILQAQREAVRRIWTDPAILPAERAAATQAQSERTGDAIRAVLDDQQKKLYNRSRSDNPLPPGDKRGVEQWMDAAHAPRPGN